MNRWQKIYCNENQPKTKVEKQEFELLGKIADYVIVHTKEFVSPIPSQCHPAETKTYTLSETENDLPHGVATPQLLARNLVLWESRGYVIEYH